MAERSPRRARPAGVLRAALAGLLGGLLLAAAALAAEGCQSPLFICETSRPGKFIQICATEVEPGRRWEDIQYRFGDPSGKPELAFPANPKDGASALLFSHTQVKSDYRVSVRFVSGPYTYRVFSNSAGQSAGVQVTDAQGKTVSTVSCIERPHMFPAYLRQALTCDKQNPHGAAACGEKPLALAK